MLGIASDDQSDHIYHGNVIDIVILVAMSVLVWALAWTKKKLDRFEGHCDAGALCGLSCVYLHAVA